MAVAAPRLLLAAGLVLLLASSAASGETNAPPDVLLIAVDDLNDWVGHLGGHPQAKTPNIDRLASLGVSFTNAHSPATTCNAARSAVMSGLRPSTTGIYSNKSAGILSIDRVPPITRYFSDHGYRVIGGGKVFDTHQQGDRTLFDEYYQPLPLAARAERAYNGRGNLDWHALPIEEDEMPDHKLVSWALEKLAEEQPGPMLLAVGLTKPHLPWWVPKRFFDLYKDEQIALPRVREDDQDDLPPAALPGGRTGRAHDWIVEAGKWREAVRGYLATVSFVDHEIGRLLDGALRGRATREIVIVLWSDHGFHLGEKRRWKKGTLWEETTRVPLVFAGPGMARGARSGHAVDTMSIYPTLVELCGLPRPTHLEGDSLAALLRDPRAPRRGVALTTSDRGNHAVRSDRWRYIRYADGSEELYDHDRDPAEWDNLAGDPRYARVKRELAAALPETEAAERLAERRPSRPAWVRLSSAAEPPAVVGPDTGIRLVLSGHPSAAAARYEIRDTTDPQSPLYWDSETWSAERRTVEAEARPLGRWQAIVRPAVEPGESRRYLALARVTGDGDDSDAVVAARRIIADGVEPEVELGAPPAARAGHQLEVEGMARDDVCLDAVDLLIERAAEQGRLFWDGRRWQAARIWQPAVLAEPRAAATAWSYRFDPGAGDGEPIRLKARARDCAANLATVRGVLSSLPADGAAPDQSRSSSSSKSSSGLSAALSSRARKRASSG